MSGCTCDKEHHAEDCPAYGEKLDLPLIHEYFGGLWPGIVDELIPVNKFRREMGMPTVKQTNQCENCFGTIHVMCFLGQNYCSENCRKELLEKTDENSS